MKSLDSEKIIKKVFEEIGPGKRGDDLHRPTTGPDSERSGQGIGSQKFIEGKLKEMG